MKNFKEKLKAKVQKLNIKQKVNELKGNIIDKINTIQNKIDPQLIFKIHSQIYYLDFSASNLSSIIEQLSNLSPPSKQHLQIYNISEHTYPSTIFPYPVLNHTSNGYPHPILIDIFHIVYSILKYITCDKEHMAVIHCQESKGRSVMVISCLMSVLGNVSHPFEALSIIARILNIHENNLILASQLQYLKLFGNIQASIHLNTHKVVLKKVIVNHVPQLCRLPNHCDPQVSPKNIVRPYLQIFQDKEILYNSLSKTEIPEALDASKHDSQQYNMDVAFNGDILIRIKHFESNLIRYPMFRTMTNSGFVFDDVMRLHQSGIDCANNLEMSVGFFIDLIFEISVGETGDRQREEIGEVLGKCQQIIRNGGESKEKTFLIHDIKRLANNDQFQLDSHSEDISVQSSLSDYQVLTTKSNSQIKEDDGNKQQEIKVQQDKLQEINVEQQLQKEVEQKQEKLEKQPELKEKQVESQEKQQESVENVENEEEEDDEDEELEEEDLDSYMKNLENN